EEQLQLLIEELAEHATFMLNDEGRIASWNPRAEQMLGFGPEEILGGEFRNVFAIEPGGKNFPRELIEAATREGRAELTVPLTRKNHEPFQARAKVIAVRGQSRRLRGFVCVLQDPAKCDAVAGHAAERVAKLEAASREMERFTHAIALDLRLPCGISRV